MVNLGLTRWVVRSLVVGCLFVFENKAAKVFGVKFHDDWADVGVLLGGDREGVGEGVVKYRLVVGRKVVLLLGRLDDGNDDLLIDDGEDFGWRGVGVDRQAVDTNRVGAGGLLQMVNLVGEL